MKRGKKRGFTIIEVTLVLAIAGLIFLMIFIALPALRRTQRDSQRRDDMMAFLKEVKSFQTNNRGALPSGGDTLTDYVWNQPAVTNAADSSWGGFFRDYMGDDFIDPAGTHYNLTVAKCKTADDKGGCVVDGLTKLSSLSDLAFPNNYKLIVITQATCEGEKPVKVTNPRKLAVLYRLEGAGAYCGNT